MLDELGRWWRGLRGHSDERAGGPERWIMLDVETTGLDPRADQLLAIAALAMRFVPTTGRLELSVGDSFEVVLRQEKPSGKDNILIHHIGVQAQSEGCAPAEALEQFRVWAGNVPFAGVSCGVRSGNDRARVRRHQLKPLDNEWLDIEPIARLVGGNAQARALDDWLEHFGIECAVRHQAASDAFATAELLLRLWPAVRLEAQSWPQLRRLSRHAAWVPR